MYRIVVCLGLASIAACGSDDGPRCVVREGALAHCGGGGDASRVDGPAQCDPLTQTGCAAGEKCTWLLDALAPDHVGHVGCAPNGTAMVGEDCMFGTPGTTGVDNCIAGLACSADQGTGTCRQLCDLEGGDPQCGIVATCTAHASIFVTQGMSPTVGLCEML